MQKPSRLAAATAIFAAGIGNAFIYTFGFLILVALQFVTQGGGGASFASVVSSFIVTLIFSTLLSCIITFVLAFPLAMIFHACGFTDKRAYFIAPAIGAVLACLVAAQLSVVFSTYVAIVAFAYITAGFMWLALGRSGNAASARAKSDAVDGASGLKA